MITTSVYERMREIGVTMATGTSGDDVIRLVLYECLLIGVFEDPGRYFWHSLRESDERGRQAVQSSRGSLRACSLPGSGSRSSSLS